MNKQEISTKDFYVYLHRKATTGEVFYIGKGTGGRAYDRANRSLHWKNIVKKHGLIVEIVESGLQEWAAFEIECGLIALHGRKDEGLGPLVNQSDGGEGPSGHKRSERTKELCRVAASNAWNRPEHAEGIIARWDEAARAAQSSRVAKARAVTEVKHRVSAASKAMWEKPDYREKITKAISAAWSNPESREKRIASLSASIRLDRATPVFCVEEGKKFPAVVDAAKWLRDTKWGKASSSNIIACCKGRVATAYGHTWRYAELS